MHRKCRFGHKFKMINNLLDQNITKAVSPMDLTATQSAVLGFIVKNEATVIYPRDIEKQFGFKHPTINGILKRLYEKDFIEFLSDDRDKRFKRIRVTEKGSEYNKKVKNILEKMELEITAGFSDEEVGALDDMLKRIIQNVSAM